jgi:hypothetical protein
MKNFVIQYILLNKINIFNGFSGGRLQISHVTKDGRGKGFQPISMYILYFTRFLNWRNYAFDNMKKYTLNILLQDFNHQ